MATDAARESPVPHRTKARVSGWVAGAERSDAPAAASWGFTLFSPSHPTDCDTMTILAIHGRKHRHEDHGQARATQTHASHALFRQCHPAARGHPVRNCVRISACRLGCDP
jgi:hypothetical protein